MTPANEREKRWMWAEGDTELRSGTHDGLRRFRRYFAETAMPTVSPPTCAYSVIVDALPWRDRVCTPYSWTWVDFVAA